MALAIRIARHGCANRPFHHIVVIQKHRARDAKVLEQIGSYDPMPNKDNEKLCAINFDRMKHWIAVGAEPSDSLKQLLGLCGFFPIHPMTYIQAARNRKKAEERAEEERLKQAESIDSQSADTVDS